MSKRFIGAIIILLMGVSLAIYLSRDDKPIRGAIFSKKELAKQYAETAARLGLTNPPAQAVLKALDLSQPVRLAIGGLGLTDNEKNRQLGDLVTVNLTGTPGFTLVERQSLATILKELNLSWSGFVRANDAVRIGKLLRVDWFLLGTEAKINGTNSLVVRMVDAHTGVMWDAGVFSEDQSSMQLAENLATFARQSRLNAANPKLRVYLAIGAFEDVGVNNRQADFPTQLRGYLTAAYRGSNVTLLEREYVETLLQEVHLDLAGLTDDAGTNPIVAMQSAFWLVSGQYQSYETTNRQVEVNLDVQRIFGMDKRLALRGLPGEAIGEQVKAAVDDIMNQSSVALVPTRASEARIQMNIGKELTEWKTEALHGDFDLVNIGSQWYGNQSWGSDPQLATLQKRRLEDAIRTFETVLLLEPANREAKMYLAACFRNQIVLNVSQACDYYREIIKEPKQDKWSGLAQKALVETFNWFSPDEKIQWLQSALNQTTNQTAIAFYHEQMKSAEEETIIDAGGSPQAEELAKQRMFKVIHSADQYFHGKFGQYQSDFGMNEYIKAVGDPNNAPHKLAELLPEMKKLAPDLEPYLVTSVLSFQLNTNTPAVADFQAVLAESLAHPERILNSDQLWVNMGHIYYWCFEKTNYPLAVQLMEARRQAATKGYAEFDDEEKIKLAYAYLAVARWQDALDIFQLYENRPFPAQNDGPWGAAFQPIMTEKLIAFCRQKLGQTVEQNSRKFDMGKPVLCLCSPSTFIADDNGLWIGSSGRLVYLDFDLKTNLNVKLPMDGALPITALCLAENQVWIGTSGGGLIEYDKTSRQCHHFSEADGLLMDYISSLQVANNSLWIGYGSASGGGLGQLDLTSQKFRSFTPSLNVKAFADNENDPPHEKIKAIVTGADGNLQMLVGSRIRQFSISNNRWATLPKQTEDWVRCISADAEHFVEAGQDLAILNSREKRWQHFVDADAMPNPPSTVTLAGDDLWVGGEGFIALVDLQQCQTRKFCYIQTSSVNRIQIGGGYVWAQFDWHLYRAPLSALQGPK